MESKHEPIVTWCLANQVCIICIVCITCVGCIAACARAYKGGFSGDGSHSRIGLVSMHWPIRFVALVAVVAVVSLCYPLHQREKFLGDTSYSRTGLLFIRQVALLSLRYPSNRSLSNSAPFFSQSTGVSSLIHGLIQAILVKADIFSVA